MSPSVASANVNSPVIKKWLPATKMAIRTGRGVAVGWGDVGFLQVGTGKMLPLSPGLSGQLEGRDPSVVKIAPFGGIL